MADTTNNPDGTAGADIFTDDLTGPVTIAKLLDRFKRFGPNAEYGALEARLGVGRRRRQTNSWQYTRDAVDGTGGYTNGQYLYSYRLEVDSKNAPTQKLVDRREQADYANFAKDVCMSAWDQIVVCKDLIVRKTTDTRLGDFWMNVDRRGTAIMDFLEPVFKQARMFGTAYIFMDRPGVAIENQADDLTPTNAPYLYTVPSQNIVQWTFDDNDCLSGIVIVEPSDQYYENVNLNDGYAHPRGPHNLRIWTNDWWSLLKADIKADKDGQVASGDQDVPYSFVDGGVNPIGKIPMITVFNEDPGPRKLLGITEMFDVARVSQTVYNIDSEAREIERKCALFLAMPVKDAKEFDSKTIEVGTDSMMVYDGEAGQPHWVSPDLAVLDKLAHKRQEKIEDAYTMAHLRVLDGNIQTKSGFHAEIEFQKTERRIARHAAQLESSEMRIAAMFFEFIGVTNNHDGTLYEITYPREYGVRDIEKLLERTQTIIGLGLGDDVNKVTIEQFFKVLYSRKSQTEIASLVNSAVAALKAAEAAAAAATAPGNNKSGGGGGTTGVSSTARLQMLLGRTAATDAVNDLKSS